MSFSADQFGMMVVIPGAGRIVNQTYKGDGSTTFAKGDLIRVTTSGQIKDAATDSDTVGACHGIVLDTWSTAPTTSQYVPVFLFASDTELQCQVYDGTAADAEPQDVAVGTKLELRNGSAGIWCVITTTTKGVATVTAIPGDAKWYAGGFAVDEDYGYVQIRFGTDSNNLSIADGYAA